MRTAPSRASLALVGLALGVSASALNCGPTIREIDTGSDGGASTEPMTSGDFTTADVGVGGSTGIGGSVGVGGTTFVSSGGGPSGGGGSTGVVIPVPGSPVGTGNLGAPGALTQVTVLKTGVAIPQAFKVTPSGPDRISLVSTTDDLLEVQYDLANWPPRQAVRRKISGHAATLFDLSDNGDFTYAFVAQAANPASYLLGDRVGNDSIPTVRKESTSVAQNAWPAFSLARLDETSFWAFNVDNDHSKPFYIGREAAGSIEVSSRPVLCEPYPAQFAIGTLGIDDHFLAALDGADASCTPSAHNKKTMISIISVPKTGPLDANVTSTIDVGQLPNGTMLKPRPGGAWLTVVLPNAIELFPVTADGTTGALAATIPATVAPGQANMPALDEAATSDGGLFITWYTSEFSDPVSIDVARVDAAGALVERGSIHTVPDWRYCSSFSMARHQDRYDVFLGLGEEEDDTPRVYAIELSDSP